jgi:hypothetical protein
VNPNRGGGTTLLLTKTRLHRGLPIEDTQKMNIDRPVSSVEDLSLNLRAPVREETGISLRSGISQFSFIRCANYDLLDIRCWRIQHRFWTVDHGWRKADHTIFSNPLAPTTSLEPATYRCTMVVERLVQRRDVDASNPLVTTILSPLGSMRYAALRALVSVYGQHGQLLQFLFGILEALAVPSRLKY